MSQYPLRVTRDEFRERARIAGWEPRTIALFLLPEYPVSKPVSCGKAFLFVTDWNPPQCTGLVSNRSLRK